jgi:hypothetical protein
LERFKGYTLATIRAESAELLQLIKIEALGRPDEGGDAV